MSYSSLIPQHPLVTSISDAQLLVSLTESITLPAQLQVVQLSQVFPSFIHQHKRYKEGAFGMIEVFEANFCETPKYDLESPYNHMKILSGMLSLPTCLSH